MLIFDPEMTCAALPWQGLIQAVKDGFVRDIKTPPRHHHRLDMGPEEKNTLLIMPSWSEQYTGVKIVSVAANNGKIGLPAVSSSYLLLSRQTGQALAMIDGGELTARRTAAASALAATYLARSDASRHLVVGAGRLSFNLIQAYASIHPIREVQIWARRIEQSEAVAREARRLGFNVTAVENLEAAVRKADIVSCCTLSRLPLVKGSWLQPGMHIDLVGGFQPTMREADDDVVSRSAVFVDTVEGAMAEAGDIIQPFENGALKRLEGDLFDLCAGRHAGRKSSEQITVFKSVGTALEDLVAAALVYESRCVNHAPNLTLDRRPSLATS